MKTIVLFGAGKSSTALIRDLSETAVRNGWLLIVADASAENLKRKLAPFPQVKPAVVSVENAVQRRQLLQPADLVISLLPPALHIVVARECLALRKNLLTASYVDKDMRAMEPEIRSAGVLFLYEMGLDPGIDHMSAMELIHRLREQGARFTGFRSHTGGLVAPESDDNPWHYKISWNPRNVVRAGSSGAVYKENGDILERSYSEVFAGPAEVDVPGAGPFVAYPNRDSLSYIPIYGLSEAGTFLRTTLRHADYCSAWLLLVRTGLTDDKMPLNEGVDTFAGWSRSLQPFITPANRPLFEQLGVLEDSPLPPDAATSADILQYLVESRWRMKETDHDMIVMLHEFEFTRAGKPQKVSSSLVVKGEDSTYTAMAKTVGLPLAIAAKLILEEKITLRGLHIPILPEIYLPVLAELELKGISFVEQEY